MKRICTFCNIEQPLESFPPNKSSVGGRRPYCRTCKNAAQAAYNLRTRSRRPEKQTPEVRAARKRAYALANRDRDLAAKRDWAQRNSEGLRRAKAQYQRQRRSEDVEFSLLDRLRTRVRMALARGTKSGSVVELTGCSVADLRAHLERHFAPGMSWGNRSRWHIDHVRPCSSFDLTDPAQQRACFHFTNLQPLWARDNLAKGARFEQQEEDAA